MAEAISSPKWKKPSDIIKKHRVKKRLSLQPVSQNIAEKHSDVFSPVFAQQQSTKRKRNPFSQDKQSDLPSKRHCKLSAEDNVLQEKDQNVLFTILGNIDKNSETVQSQSEVCIEKSHTSTRQQNVPAFSLEDDDSKSQFDFVEKFFSTANKQSEHKEVKCSNDSTRTSPGTRHDLSTVPIDWSLRVKLRVISDQPLLWCTQLKSSEEAQGVSQFVSREPNLQCTTESSKKISLQQSSMYWIYPSLPWIKLFPRIVPDSKIRMSTSVFLDDVVQAALQNDWTESFTSVFHQLRAQECPYFYVCTHQFTALFRAAGLFGQSSITALLAPTTRGFRESLKTEDITFRMPVLERQKNSGTSGAGTESQTNEDNSIRKNNEVSDNLDEDDDDFLSADEGASVWLESIGLDKKQFPSLDPNKVKIQREGFRVIDNRPESLVCVHGADVQGLFNFLLNSRSCMASSGSQAGVPPTLLAPTSFKGATLKSHKIKHSIVKQMDNNSHFNQVHVLEVTGPILPHHVVNYCDLYNKTQNGDFTLMFNTHEPTVPFNVELPSLQTDSSTWRDKLNMNNDRYTGFFSAQPLADRLCSIKEVHCNSGEYSVVTT